jgi:hypothetical protein
MLRRATLLVQGGDGDVRRGWVEHQAAVDLVGADREVVALGQGGDAAQLVPVEDAAHRVVGVAQHEQAHPVGHGGLGGGPVPLPALAAVHQGCGDQALLEVGRGVQEGRVHRGGGEHPVTGLADGPHCHVEAGDHPRQPHQPLGLDAPGVVPGNAFDHRLEHRGPGVGIAENAMVDARMEGFQHRRGRGKVHVGHPHGDHVAAGVAAPLDAVGAGAIRRGAEVEGHQDVRLPGAGRARWTGSARRRTG